MPSPVANSAGAYDQDGVYGEVVSRHPEASVIVPPRSGAVPSDTARTAPTMRDRHLQTIAERGRMAWQKTSGYNWRALLEADIDDGRLGMSRHDLTVDAVLIVSTVGGEQRDRAVYLIEQGPNL